ncbi:hypothetical protein ACFSUK_25170 [Sphingobium scionense]
MRHLPLLVQASGRYNFVRSPRFPMPRALPGAVDRFDDDINALTLYTREELRLDVDGRYPQMTVSGTRAGPLGPVVSWVAALTRTGANHYSGQIWFKDGQVGAIPHTQISLKVTKSLLAAQRKVEATFTGGGAASFVRTYIFSSSSFRPTEFEYDTVAGATRVTEIGTHDHPNHPATMASETLSLDTVYRRAGFNVGNASGGGAIPLDAVGADQRWTDQEMHDAMQIYWSRFTDKPQWSLWVLFASLHVQGSSLGGIMFDDIGSNHRQGTAIFTDAFIANPPAGDADPDAWVRRMRFWTAAHEVGHAFNLAHSWQKALGTPWIPLADDPEARSFMNYPYAVAGGQAAFFADFDFRFSDPELLFMRHAPERFVQMGNADWFDQHGFSQVAMDSNEEFGLTLSVNARDNRLPYLLPPVVEMALVNRSGRPKLASAARLSERAGLTLIISKDGRPARQWSPYSRHCGESLEIILGQGRRCMTACWSAPTAMAGTWPNRAATLSRQCWSSMAGRSSPTRWRSRSIRPRAARKSGWRRISSRRKSARCWPSTARAGLDRRSMRCGPPRGCASIPSRARRRSRSPDHWPTNISCCRWMSGRGPAKRLLRPPAGSKSMTPI